jgi:hypothetical protein
LILYRENSFGRDFLIVKNLNFPFLSFFPVAKFAFDFGRLPLHWPIAKYILKTLGYKELLNHSQRDIMAALRIWMVEDTRQVETFFSKNILFSNE